MPGLKSFRRKRSWPRKGEYPSYGSYPPDQPGFWAQSAILLALAKEDGEEFSKVLSGYLALPDRPRDLGSCVDLLTAVEDSARRGLDLGLYLQQYRPPNTPLLAVLDLLPLLQKWNLNARFLVPLAWAAKEAATVQDVEGALHAQAYVWPRATLPFHEVQPGRKAKVPKGLDLEAPFPAKTRLQKGEVKGWKPVPGQGKVRFTYRARPDQLARRVAWHLLGESYLEIAKRVTGKDDLLDGDSVVRRVGREIQDFLDLARGGLENPVPGGSPGVIGGLTPEDEALWLWAQRREAFTLRDVLRSGPKALRKRFLAQAALLRLVKEGYLIHEGEVYRLNRAG